MYVYNPSNFNVNYANSAGNVNGYTASQLIGSSNLSGNGWTKLSSGLIIQWGTSQNNNTNFPPSIAFPIAFNSLLYVGQPAYTNPNSADPSVSVYSYSNTGLGFVSNMGNRWNFTWFALGI